MPRKVRCQFFEWSSTLGSWYWCGKEGAAWRADRLYCQKHFDMLEAEMLEYISSAG